MTSVPPQSQGRATVDQILTVEHPTEDHLY
jgi:hypothetical protein